MWENILNFIFRAESMAIFLGAAIVIGALMLFIKKLINFLMVVFLLIFSIVVGFAVVNYDLVREAAVDKNSEERRILEGKWESLKEKLEQFIEMFQSDESKAQFFSEVHKLDLKINDLRELLEEERDKNLVFRNQVISHLELENDRTAR